MPPFFGNFSHYRKFFRDPTTGAKINLPTCLDWMPPTGIPLVAEGSQLTATGFYPFLAPQMPFLPPVMTNAACPQNAQPFATATVAMDPRTNFTTPIADPVTGGNLIHMGDLDFNLCLNGYQMIALGTVANPMNPMNPAPMPTGLMLKCKGPGDNYSMELRRFTGNCYGMSASLPINIFKIPLEKQDSFLSGGCIDLGDSGYIKFTGLNALTSAQLGYPTSVVPDVPILGNKLANCSHYHRLGRTPPPAPQTVKLWDWAAIRQQYRDINGVELDHRLPTWKSWYIPTKKDPKPVSNSG